MEKIRKYIDNFFKKHEENIRFTMSSREMIDAAKYANSGNVLQAISDIFSFGYAKGYRAALSEMKKSQEV